MCNLLFSILFFLLIGADSSRNKTLGDDWAQNLQRFLQVAGTYPGGAYSEVIAKGLAIFSGAAYYDGDVRNCLTGFHVTRQYNYTLEAIHLHDTIHAFTGYGDGFILVSIEGSATWLELLHQGGSVWWVPPRPFSNEVPGAEVISYWYNTASGLKDQITDSITEALNACGPNCNNIYFTGHSLGASTMIIALAFMKLDNYFQREHLDRQMYFYSYGSPRAGNLEFAKYAESIDRLEMYRVVHKEDPIPHFPCCIQDNNHQCITDNSKYSPWHIQGEIWYTDEACTQFVECDGTGEDPHCSSSETFNFVNIDDHLYYFGVHLSQICPLTEITSPKKNTYKSYFRPHVCH